MSEHEQENTAQHETATAHASAFGGGWNHRVVRREYPHGEVGYSIHEAYYAPDGTVANITATAVEPYGESLDVLREEISIMIRACEKPVLDFDTLQEWLPSVVPSSEGTQEQEEG